MSWNFPEGIGIAEQEHAFAIQTQNIGYRDIQNFSKSKCISYMFRNDYHIDSSLCLTRLDLDDKNLARNWSKFCKQALLVDGGAGTDDNTMRGTTYL